MIEIPSEKEIQWIRESLYKFNEQIVGEDGHSPLNLMERDEHGAVIGGLLGGTYWGWLYIDILWVREDHRNRGIGTKLLQEAEREALRRNCHHAHVDTMSWQAPLVLSKTRV